MSNLFFLLIFEFLQFKILFYALPNSLSLFDYLLGRKVTKLLERYSIQKHKRSLWIRKKWAQTFYAIVMLFYENLYCHIETLLICFFISISLTKVNWSRQGMIDQLPSNFCKQTCIQAKSKFQKPLMANIFNTYQLVMSIIVFLWSRDVTPTCKQECLYRQFCLQNLSMLYHRSYWWPQTYTTCFYMQKETLHPCRNLQCHLTHFNVRIY